MNPEYEYNPFEELEYETSKQEIKKMDKQEKDGILSIIKRFFKVM
jgi:hypothetical protein